MIIGIATISVSGLLLGISPMPSGPLLSLDIPLPTETIGQLDLAGALHHGLFSIIFTLTIVDLFDNMGTLIGLAHKAGFTRPDGRIDNLDRALITDSLSTITTSEPAMPRYLPRHMKRHSRPQANLFPLQRKQKRDRIKVL